MNRVFRTFVMQRMHPCQAHLTAMRNMSSANIGVGTGATNTGTIDKAALDVMVRTNKVVVFMKGNPEAPRCGFSNAVVQILRMHGVRYDAHDVLQNEELRQAIKDYSDWPTIPQIFINGDFVGGCDILLHMHQNGDLIEELKNVGITSSLLEATEAVEGTKQSEKK